MADDSNVDDEILKLLVAKPESLEAAQGVVRRYLELSESLGSLAMTWAGLDTAIDEMFEPLLECSEAQVACILVENIEARCKMLKKLLHVEQLPPNWVAWAEALLNRASGELAKQRNRYIHDAWRITRDQTMRTDKRATVEKAQSRQKKALRYKVEHHTTAKDIDRLEDRVVTVSFALRAATKSLRLWRSEGRRPRLSRQWLPASKPNARMLNYQAHPEALEKPLSRLRYEFD